MDRRTQVRVSWPPVSPNRWKKEAKGQDSQIEEWRPLKALFGWCNYAQNNSVAIILRREEDSTRLEPVHCAPSRCDSSSGVAMLRMWSWPDLCAVWCVTVPGLGPGPGPGPFWRCWNSPRCRRSSMSGLELHWVSTVKLSTLINKTFNFYSVTVCSVPEYHCAVWSFII